MSLCIISIAKTVLSILELVVNEDATGRSGLPVFHSKMTYAPWLLLDLRFQCFREPFVRLWYNRSTCRWSCSDTDLDHNFDHTMANIAVVCMQCHASRTLGTLGKEG